MRLASMLRFVGSSTAPEDTPLVWGFKGNSDEPSLGLEPAARGNTYNIWADLDDSPTSWHITEPVDPTAYYNEYIGDNIGDLY